jgi:hypothetical protein
MQAWYLTRYLNHLVGKVYNIVKGREDGALSNL